MPSGASIPFSQAWGPKWSHSDHCSEPPSSCSHRAQAEPRVVAETTGCYNGPVFYRIFWKRRGGEKKEWQTENSHYFASVGLQLSQQHANYVTFQLRFKIEIRLGGTLRIFFSVKDTYTCWHTIILNKVHVYFIRKTPSREDEKAHVWLIFNQHSGVWVFFFHLFFFSPLSVRSLDAKPFTLCLLFSQRYLAWLFLPCERIALKNFLNEEVGFCYRK